MTIEYEDGTFSTKKIPIDSSAFHKVEENSRVADQEVFEYVGTEAEIETPMYDVINGGWFYLNNTSSFPNTIGPKTRTEPHCYVQRTNGLIVGFGQGWIVITKHANVWFYWRDYQVNRTATIMGLQFFPGPIDVPISICEWDYYINYYFIYQPYAPSQTRQEFYTDIRYVK